MELIVDNKRLTYIFNNDFELSAINDAITFLNNSDLPINFFINTPGGYTSFVHPLTKAIEDYEDIVLYPIEECSSSGFFLLMNTTVPICLLDKAIRSIVHFPRIDCFVDLNETPIYDKKELKLRSANNKFKDLLLELPLDQKQLKKLLRGEDLVLYHDSLSEIFKDRLIHE